MAHVSGPTSSRPGSKHAFPAGSMCDSHPEVLAVARIQGETDSFGAEYIDMCSECLAAHQKYQEESLEEERLCDWCKNMAKHVIPHRDIDEGSYGRLYQVCRECRVAEYDRIQEQDEAGDSW